MNTVADTAARGAVDLTIAENTATLMHRAKVQQKQVAAAIGMSPQTISRRVAGEQPFFFWEVQALARYFDVTIEEIAGTLPDRAAWLVRHQGLEPRTRCFGPKRSHLRLVGPDDTPDGGPAGSTGEAVI